MWTRSLENDQMNVTDSLNPREDVVLWHGSHNTISQTRAYQDGMNMQTLGEKISAALFLPGLFHCCTTWVRAKVSFSMPSEPGPAVKLFSY